MSELLLEKISHDELLNKLQEFYNYAKKRLKIDRDPKIILKKDNNNSEDFLGKTGYYDPEEEKVVLFIVDRHAKDIVRSLSHELIHHTQKIKGFTDNIDLSDTANDPLYALHNSDLRKMEKQAFLWGDMIFRDWTDKQKIKRKNTMNEKKETTFKEKEAAIKKSLVKQGKSSKQASKIAPKIAGAEAAGKRYQGPGKPMKELDEASKPDFLDLDKDGNRKEPMKLAAKQAKKIVKKENNMKLKMTNQKDIEEAKNDDETEEVSDFRPNISRNLADVPDEAGEEEIEVELDGEEDERTGGTLPLKSKEQMAADKLNMDLDTYRRFMASRKPAQKIHATEEDIAELDAKIAALQAEREAARKQLESDPEAQEVLANLDKEEMQESKNNPYPVLFEQRERLLKQAFQTREERIYNELIKRFIK